MFRKQEAGKGAVTPFQAVTTALSATVGTGNIVGTTQAIALGGYGAVFWMWLAALGGMVTKYSEVTLAIKYRERDAKGDWGGGPMYYIKNGLGKTGSGSAQFTACSPRSPRSASATARRPRASSAPSTAPSPRSSPRLPAQSSISTWPSV
jgi:Na+/alanine symporter